MEDKKEAFMLVMLREHPLRTSPREGRGSPQWGHIGTGGGGSKLIRTSPLNINIIKL